MAGAHGQRDSPAVAGQRCSDVIAQPELELARDRPGPRVRGVTDVGEEHVASTVQTGEETAIGCEREGAGLLSLWSRGDPREDLPARQIPKVHMSARAVEEGG